MFRQVVLGPFCVRKKERQDGIGKLPFWIVLLLAAFS
jgi:hypothetical protein